MIANPSQYSVFRGCVSILCESRMLQRFVEARWVTQLVNVSGCDSYLTLF
jgi:hypothetical protein